MAEKMSVKLLRFCFILLITLNASCAHQLTPQDVAEHFWAAIEQDDIRAVKRHVTAADAVALDSLDDILPVTNTVLERTVIEQETAFIDTTVTVGEDKPLSFPLKTYLVMEDKRWKIDYAKTISAVATAGKLAAIINKVHDFGSALQQGIDRSVQELDHTLPQIEHELSRIEDQLKQQIPELRKRLEHFARQLEEAIKNPRQREQDTEPNRSIAI